jgi:hypothetical protein
VSNSDAKEVTLLDVIVLITWRSMYTPTVGFPLARAKKSSNDRMLSFPSFPLLRNTE